MKYKLPNLNGKETRVRVLQMRVDHSLVSLLLTLASATLACAQEPAQFTTANGQEIVVQAAKQMILHPSLEAKMRQRVGIQERYMVGSGAYLQLRHGEDVRFRLELRLQVGERLTSLQHITDSRYLYIRRDIGDMKTVSRIDLRRVQEAQAGSTAGNSLASYASLGVGGLSQLLHSLAHNFTFGKPEPETISGVNVWRVQGRWNPEALAKLLPEKSAAILAANNSLAEQLPPQLPHQVSLVVGRDGPLPLFPYRVEFSRVDKDSNKQQSMLIMELFEVRLRPDLDPRLFEVPDSEQDLVDETDVYLRKHGLVPVE